MSAKVWRPRGAAIGWVAVSGALSVACGGWLTSAWAGPDWIQGCPQRITQASGCNHLPSEGRMALRVPVPGDDGGRWGFVDMQGHMVIAPVYDSVMTFSQGLAAAHQDGKWGFIDPQGRWRVEPRYDDVTSFDPDGVAWAIDQGRLLRLNTAGDAAPWLREAGVFDLDHRSMQDDRAVRVRLTPPPETWRLDTGEVIRWPSEVTQLGRPVEGAWPVSVRLPSGRAWWGLWSLQEGRWVASPQDLRSESEPLRQADTVAVQRGGVWLFVDLKGRPLNDTRYEAIESHRAGLWVVSPSNSLWEWLGPDLGVLHRVQGHVSAPHSEPWGDALVYDLYDALVLAYPSGRIQVIDVSEHDEHVFDGLIWLSPKGNAGRPDLIGPDGRSVLSETERERLRHHRVEFLGARDRSMPTNAAIRALLHPHDDTQAPGVITGDGRVLTQPDWVLLMPGTSPTDPVVVQRTDGRFGAIDGLGRWVIPPQWLGLEAFHHGLAWGRHPTHEGGVRPVLIGVDGRRLPLPAEAFRQCSGWTGRWLRCEGEAPTFLDPLTSRRVVAAGVDEVREARDTWLLARQGERWGVLGADGDWRVPPLSGDPDAIEWLDEQVVRVAVHRDGRLTHQLWHVTDGRPLTPPRHGQSWRLAPDRYLVAGEQAGVVLLDGSGRVLMRSPWWGTDPQAHGALAWTNPGQQLARPMPDGTLNPVPVHLQDGDASTAGSDDDAADALAVQGWHLRLSARCGQLIVHGPTGRQTWPAQAVRCRQP